MAASGNSGRHIAGRCRGSSRRSRSADFIRLLLTCAAVLFLDGFDTQAIGYVAPLWPKNGPDQGRARPGNTEAGSNPGLFVPSLAPLSPGEGGRGEGRAFRRTLNPCPMPCLAAHPARPAPTSPRKERGEVDHLLRTSHHRGAVTRSPSTRTDLPLRSRLVGSSAATGAGARPIAGLAARDASQGAFGHPWPRYPHRQAMSALHRRDGRTRVTILPPCDVTVERGASSVELGYSGAGDFRPPVCSLKSSRRGAISRGAVARDGQAAIKFNSFGPSNANPAGRCLRCIRSIATTCRSA